MKRTLQSLSLEKKQQETGQRRPVGVLVKRPPGKTVAETDVFTFNENFIHPKLRIPIPQIAAPVTVSPCMHPASSVRPLICAKQVEEETQEQRTVEGDREATVSAAIVRVMKGRKKLDHTRLVGETVEAVKKHFKPTTEFIKKRIEKLIEEEYIERDKNSPTVYVYKA